MDTLVVAPSWIGDAVLSHPLLARLKARDPQGAIDVLAPAWASAVYGRMPEVRRTIAFPFGHGELKLGDRRRFARELPRYDRAILLPNSLKSALVPWFAGIPVRTGWRGEMRYGLLNDLRRWTNGRCPSSWSASRRWRSPRARPSSARFPSPGWRSILRGATPPLAKFALDAASPVLALAPGAEYGPAKRWPARHFAEIARAHAERGFRTWLFGSAKDAAITAEVAALAGVPVADLAGRTTLDEAIDLLSLAARVVTNDSGLMHVAAALDRPMAAVFGSSSPAYTPPLSAQGARDLAAARLQPLLQARVPARPHELPREARAGPGPRGTRLEWAPSRHPLPGYGP